MSSSCQDVLSVWQLQQTRIGGSMWFSSLAFTWRLAAAGEKFRGQHVIVTATLGCLKAGDIKFDPELPKWKSEAIATLGFGNLNKVRNG